MLSQSRGMLQVTWKSSNNIFYNYDIDIHDLIAFVVVVLVVDRDDIKNVEENHGLGHYSLVGSSSWLQLEYEVVICDKSGVFSKKQNWL